VLCGKAVDGQRIENDGSSRAWTCSSRNPVAHSDTIVRTRCGGTGRWCCMPLARFLGCLSRSTHCAHSPYSFIGHSHRYVGYATRASHKSLNIAPYQLPLRCDYLRWCAAVSKRQEKRKVLMHAFSEQIQKLLRNASNGTCENRSWFQNCTQISDGLLSCVLRAFAPQERIN